MFTNLRSIIMKMLNTSDKAISISYVYVEEYVYSTDTVAIHKLCAIIIQIAT